MIKIKDVEIKIKNNEQLTNEEYAFLEENFLIYEGLVEGDISLLVVDLNDVLYAFKVNKNGKTPVYIGQPYRAMLMEHDGFVYVVEHVLH